MSRASRQTIELRTCTEADEAGLFYGANDVPVISC